MKESGPFFSNTENISTLYRHLLSLTNQFLPVFSLRVLSICRVLSWHVSIFSPSHSFLHPILVRNRLHNLLPLVSPQNPLRKMALIATLPLVPFQFILLSSSLFFLQIKAYFSPRQSLWCSSALPSYIIVSFLFCSTCSFMDNYTQGTLIWSRDS